MSIIPVELYMRALAGTRGELAKYYYYYKFFNDDWNELINNITRVSQQQKAPFYTALLIIPHAFSARPLIYHCHNSKSKIEKIYLKKKIETYIKFFPFNILLWSASLVDARDTR